MSAGRYDRQELKRGWNQSALSDARVMVVGAGGLSNELIKDLALAGVGHMLVVDFDSIEVSNLNRTVLFRDADVGLAKAQVAAEAAARLNPDLDLRYINGDLFYDVGLGFYRRSRLVVGGLDSLAARSQVGLNCSLAGVPFFDGGMWESGGEVRLFLEKDGACFECGLSDADRLRVYERRSCTMFSRGEGDPDEQLMPATVTTAAIIGGLLAQEAVRYLCGAEVRGGEAIVYNALRLSMHSTTLPRDGNCSYHEPYRAVTELGEHTNRSSAAELLDLARTDSGGEVILELGRDFLLGFSCPKCGRYEEVNALVGKVGESRVACPSCGAARAADVVSRLDGSEPYADRRLCDLGVPPGEVLAAHTAGGLLRFYELTGDVNAFWA